MKTRPIVARVARVQQAGPAVEGLQGLVAPALVARRVAALWAPLLVDPVAAQLVDPVDLLGLVDLEGVALVVGLVDLLGLVGLAVVALVVVAVPGVPLACPDSEGAISVRMKSGNKSMPPKKNGK